MTQFSTANQITTLRDFVERNFPNGLETSLGVLLEFLSHSNDDRVKDTVACIKVSKSFPAIMDYYDFGMSLLRNLPRPITETNYDTALKVVFDIHNYLADKYSCDDSEKGNAKSSNYFFYFLLSLPGKDYLFSKGYIIR